MCFLQSCPQHNFTANSSSDFLIKGVFPICLQFVSFPAHIVLTSLKQNIKQENFRYPVSRSRCLCCVNSCSCWLPTTCGRWRGLRNDKQQGLCHLRKNSPADDAGIVVCDLRTRLFSLIPPLRDDDEDENRELRRERQALGVSPDPGKIKAATDFPVPKALKDLRSFIGLSSYFRHLVRGFATIAVPLMALLRKDIAFKWTPDCVQAFSHLKHPDAPVKLHTDASSIQEE